MPWIRSCDNWRVFMLFSYKICLGDRLNKRQSLRWGIVFLFLVMVKEIVEVRSISRYSTGAVVNASCRECMGFLFWRCLQQRMQLKRFHCLAPSAGKNRLRFYQRRGTLLSCHRDWRETQLFARLSGVANPSMTRDSRPCAEEYSLRAATAASWSPLHPLDLTDAWRQRCIRKDNLFCGLSRWSSKML